ncbi:hypothetical protein CWI42_081460 [Ordospora colligata]|uniref:Uncharacterized protein n=1 Tax=Ordospora colligata OC4 TaxID=1354746 RepID=A0A0B2UJ86_9MICR|nr:uncharacterized protein M896_081460 [Ordospora colligata OC4]KHN69408.1 hypothetical protein M896_081460 [Ordospora colligata OC4]TBU14922.1 hypothetical protein CWI41_081450 [Ordospora colligata]TBU15053.1 hypothetical protein CWI40_081470 [Ordospora colligata]TBU18307.1 hypothetical protein CWI42_081460 [Ordospora colligata]
MNGSQGITKYISDSIANLSSLVQISDHGPQLQQHTHSENDDVMSFSEEAIPSIAIRYSSSTEELHGPTSTNERCNCNAYEEINRLKSNEQRLRTYIQALRRDLINNEESTSELKREVQQLRNTHEQEKINIRRMLKQVESLEKAFDERLYEIVEVVEYCKYLLTDE